METSDSGELPDDGNQSAASTERRRKRDSRDCIDPPSLIKESAVKHGAVDIEEQVGTRELARVGAELLGQSMCCVFYPCSLGILCMETKLMFVFLKISLKHSISIRKGERGSPDNLGKIMYTEVFDILKAEDRLKMADFLFWLGCVQDYGKYKFY